MSYILDALRRADAERERDPARGIHAQPAAGLPARTSRDVPRWTWSLGAAAVLLGAGAAWWLAPRPAPVAPVVTRPVAVQAPVTPGPVVIPVAAAVRPPPPAPLPVTAVVEKPAAKPVVAAAAPAKPVPAEAPAPAPAAERIVAVADLPPDVQRELPKLVISGGVHSENAAQRLLIVGGQLMTEGAEVAPGVTLEQIRARTAVLRYRGFKYSVPF